LEGNLIVQDEKYLKDTTKYVFYEEPLEDDNYNKDMIEELFTKKRVRITRHGEKNSDKQ